MFQKSEHPASALFLAILTIVAVIYGLTSLARTQVSGVGSEKSTLTDDDYEVYAAALRSLYPKARFDCIFIIDKTGQDIPPGMSTRTEHWAVEYQFKKELPENLMQVFESRNKSRAEISKEKLAIELEIVTLSYDDAAKAVNQPQGWEQLKKHSRNAGITVLALPAYSTDKTRRALLYIGNSCGTLCGEGKLLLMAKNDGRWQIVKQGRSWGATGNK